MPSASAQVPHEQEDKSLKVAPYDYQPIFEHPKKRVTPNEGSDEVISMHSNLRKSKCAITHGSSGDSEKAPELALSALYNLDSVVQHLKEGRDVPAGFTQMLFQEFCSESQKADTKAKGLEDELAKANEEKDSMKKQLELERGLHKQTKEQCTHLQAEIERNRVEAREYENRMKDQALEKATEFETMQHHLQEVIESNRAEAREYEASMKKQALEKATEFETMQHHLQGEIESNRAEARAYKTRMDNEALEKDQELVRLREQRKGEDVELKNARAALAQHSQQALAVRAQNNHTFAALRMMVQDNETIKTRLQAELQTSRKLSSELQEANDRLKEEIMMIQLPSLGVDKSSF